MHLVDYAWLREAILPSTFPLQLLAFFHMRIATCTDWQQNNRLERVVRACDLRLGTIRARKINGSYLNHYEP